MNRIIRTYRIRKYLLLAAMLLGGVMTAGAQTEYVIYYGSSFLGSNTTTATTSFVPNASIYTGTSGGKFRNANGYYLIGQNNNTIQFTTTQANGTNFTINTNYLTYNTYFDLICYSNTWYTYYNQAARRATIAAVTTTPVVASLTDFTINSGDAVLSSLSTYNYGHSNSSYVQAYTHYSFSTFNYYSTDPSQAASTSPPTGTSVTTGYTWSLDANGADVSFNTSTGAITVNALPATDITMTLTCSVTSNNITKTATKSIVLQGTIPNAPIISVSGNTATLTTNATGTTSIRYTLDGTAPTATTGTVYSGAIDLTTNGTSPINIKAVTVRNGNASDVTEQTVTLTLPEPTITINGEAKTATISSSVAGATIYYTTDGTTPTTSSSQYTGTITGLNYMTTIKAIAVKDGWNNSPVASGIVTIPSGVSGDVVTLFDYEPHSWSYYSDPDCPIRSLSPADVKITYYGDGIVMTGNADYTAGTNNYVSPGDANYVGGAKVNVGGENENTFVYYKTLERGANTQTTYTFSSSSQSAAESRCPYTTIPNPFQVRPTYGGTTTTNTADWAGWRGFQCWRLKSVSGGKVFAGASGGDALTVGAIINANTQIYFAPDNEYGMEVELEAVWAIAYVVKASGDGANAIGNHSGVGYERNFIVLNTTNASYNFGGNSGKRITETGRQVTVSNYLPNGVRGQNDNRTHVRGAANSYNLALGANTKFENVSFNMASNTLTAANHDLIIGRGCSGTVNNVRGMGGDNTSTLNYTIRLESGVFNYVSFIAGIAGGTGSGEMTLSGTNNKVTGVLGSDYDRAVEDATANYDYTTAPLRVTQSMSLGADPSLSNQTESEILNATVKSGYFGSGNNVGDGAAVRSFYIGIANTYNIGKRKLTVEGGKFNLSIAGGIDRDNTSDDALTIRMKGGTVAGSVYGAAAFAAAAGGRKFIFTGGTVGGWIAGGCNGTQTDGGKLTGKTFIYFGGTAQCNSNGSNTTIGPGNATGGNIFGAGSGNASATATATVGEVDQSTIVIADECMVERNVYGGGNYGYVAGTAATNKSDIYISGGNVVGSVFGGANMQKGNIVNITMKGGLVNEGVYGGSNTRGTISGNVTMQINGGTVGDGEDGDGIFGGGYGSNTAVNGNVSVTLGASTSATDSATVNGNVYGGSALGSTNAGNANNTTTVTMNKALVNGNVFGGALGESAVVNGLITVTVKGGYVNGSAFGGGDAAPYNKSGQNYPLVYMTGGRATNVFGGGKGSSATVAGNPIVTISGTSTVDGNVYGGGDAAAVTGKTKVLIQD